MLWVTMTMVTCLTEGFHELFDFVGGDGVEGGAGFVHEEDFGLGGDGAGDAEALLLAAGEGEGGTVEAVFYFVPQAGGDERSFDGLVEDGPLFNAIDARTSRSRFQRLIWGRDWVFGRPYRCVFAGR